MIMGIVPELPKQFEDGLPPSTFWDNKNNEVSNQETGLANATRKIVIAKKISACDSKPPIDAAPKKLCVCAPTSHAGSFKCRLHRFSAVQMLSTTSEAKKIGSRRSHESLKSEGQTQLLSRFGRAAAAAVENKEEETLEPNQEQKMQSQ